MVLFWYPGGTCFVPKTYCEALKLFEMETILSIRARAIPEQLPAVSAKVGTEKCLTSNLYIHVVIHFNYNDVGNYGYIYFGLSWPQRKQNLDNISMALLSTMPLTFSLSQQDDLHVFQDLAKYPYNVGLLPSNFHEKFKYTMTTPINM